MASGMPIGPDKADQALQDTAEIWKAFTNLVLTLHASERITAQEAYALTRGLRFSRNGVQWIGHLNDAIRLAEQEKRG